MTIIAVIPFVNVRFMAELDVAGSGGKLITDRTRSSGMALHAVGFYTESGFVIVTTAAGFALFHLAHTVMLIAGARNKEIRVAILAAVGGNMYRMAEFGAAGAKMNLFDRMAFLAVGFHAKGGLAIMAGTAGTPLFHVGHALPDALFTGLENLIVALHALIHTLMNDMAEGCGAGFLDLENDIDGRFVTLVTITLYAENGRAVVAAAA